MPYSNYLPFVLHWCLLDLDRKRSVCPRMVGEVTFHGHEGDWVTADSWRTVCMIAAEVCQGSRELMESCENEEEAEELVYGLSHEIDKHVDHLWAGKGDEAIFHERVLAQAQRIIDREICYASDEGRSWEACFDEWSYTAYSGHLEAEG